MPIRELQGADAQAIGAIASRTAGFTVPSPYVVEMLARTQVGLCFVNVDGDGFIDGYVLALATSQQSTIFVWQLGLADGSREAKLRTAAQLCRHLLGELVRSGVRRATFTVRQGLAFNLATAMAGDLLEGRVRTTGETFGGQGSAEAEFEYEALLPLGGDHG